MISLFHGENRGSIPLGRANKINDLDFSKTDTSNNRQIYALARAWTITATCVLLVHQFGDRAMVAGCRHNDFTKSSSCPINF